MGRNKLISQLIRQSARRRVTFKKRVKGLLKKVEEISTLCGVDACTIIFSPYNPNHPLVWPAHSGVQRVLNKFMGMSEFAKKRKKLDQESFNSERLLKLREKLIRWHQKNRKKEIDGIINRSLAGEPLDHNLQELEEIRAVLNKKIEGVTKKIRSLKGENCNPRRHHPVGMGEGNNEEVMVPSSEGDELIESYLASDDFNDPSTFLFGNGVNNDDDESLGSRKD